MAIHVEFEPVGRRGDCPQGGTLLDCARHLGVDLVNLCGGGGGCGRCIVQILEGRVSEPVPGETDWLTPAELEQGYRLACRTHPLGTCKVRVPPESLTTPQRTQVEGEEIQAVPESLIQAFDVALTAASLEDLRADAERIVAALVEQHGISAAQFDINLLREASVRLRNEEWHVCAAVRDREVVALLPSMGRCGNW
jgi:uncharacterized 2Fe-2S/4Fe-4S cluster protein (DUF4445 family)